MVEHARRGTWGIVWLRVAAAVVAAEGLVALGFGVGQTVRSGQPGPGAAIGIGLVMIAYGALLVVVAIGLGRARRWSRGPVIVTQLIQLPVAWGLREDSGGWIGIALAGAAIAVVVCVLLPSATAALVTPAGGPEDTSP